MKYQMSSKRVAIISLLMLLVVFTTTAQEGTWLYSVNFGTSFRFPNDFGPELNNILQDRKSYSQIVTNLAVGADYQFNDKLQVGPELWAALYPSAESSAAKVSLRGLGIGAKMHYKLIDLDGWLVSPYVAGGLYLTKGLIENSGFLVNKPPIYIAPGSSQGIYGQLGYLDMGLKLWMKNESNIKWGLTGGYLTRIASSDWKVSWDETVEALSPPALSLLYLRLSVAVRR